MSRVTRHTSHVTRHTSHVTRHTSHVTHHTSHVISYWETLTQTELDLARSTAMAHSATATATTSDAATAAAVKAMADHAEDWARELIESTRDPRGPARHDFPRLACPATGSLEDADALIRSALQLFDTDEDEGDCHQPPEER